MLSIVLSVLFLFLYGCQIQKQSENVTEILETVESFRKKQQINTAIDYLTQKEVYEHADLLETLAFLYEENHEHLLAAQTFEQLFHTDVDRQYIESAFHAAEIYHRWGDIYSAGRCYRLYLELNPQDYGVWFKLSAIEEQLHHSTTALTAYFNGIESIPVKTEAHIKKLSELCYHNQMLNAAQFWAQTVLKTQPNDIYVLDMLLKIADAHNDRKQAISYIQKLERQNIDVLERYPDVYKKYVYTEPVQHIIIATEQTIPHLIYATQQEIEYTLRCFSIDLKPNPRKSYLSKDMCHPLCQNYIY